MLDSQGNILYKLQVSQPVLFFAVSLFILEKHKKVKQVLICCVKSQPHQHKFDGLQSAQGD